MLTVLFLTIINTRYNDVSSGYCQKEVKSIEKIKTVQNLFSNPLNYSTCI